MKLKLIAGLILSTSLVGCGGTSNNNDDDQPTTDYSNQTINLGQIGRYQSNIFDASAAEIVTYDPTTKQTFVVNSQSGKVDVLNTEDATTPTLSQSLNVATDIGATAGSANSVAVHNGLLAVAMDNSTKTDNGWIAFYKTSDLSFIKKVEVGALPDMVTFTQDGTKVVAAIEAEPNLDYSIDPDGMVAIIDITWDGTSLTTSLTSLDFSAFNVGASRHAELPANLFLAGIGATGKASVAADLEPEYIVISKDSSKAFVALQENNGIAVINLNDKTIEKIYALGFKDHSVASNALDVNNKDDLVKIESYPVKGMYMPDSIAIFEKDNKTYLLTANEGDDRNDWLENFTTKNTCESAGYVFYKNKECRDAIKLNKLSNTDMTIKVGSDLASKEDDLANLNFSYHMTKKMNANSATDIETIYSYGARSFSVWDMDNGSLVWDSGKFFETKTAELYGLKFNNDNDENKAQGRSDNKGPEPEAITVGTINEKSYAFIGLERMGGVMVYEITNPTEPEFVQYLNNRDLNIIPGAGVDAGDLGPEGFKFVAANKSPNGKPMLIVGSEVSGTTTFYQINVDLNN